MNQAALDLICGMCTRDAILEANMGVHPRHSHRERLTRVTDSMPDFVPNVNAEYRRLWLEGQLHREKLIRTGAPTQAHGTITP